MSKMDTVTLIAIVLLSLSALVILFVRHVRLAFWGLLVACWDLIYWLFFRWPFDCHRD